jgi:hypothetical protein
MSVIKGGILPLKISVNYEKIRVDYIATPTYGRSYRHLTVTTGI